MSTWQAAEPGSVIGDGKGNYQIRQAGQWMPMPKGSLVADEHGAYHFDADAIKPPAATKTSKTDAIGEANATANAQEHGPAQDIIDMVKAVPGGLLPALKGLLAGAGAGGPDAYINRGTHIPQTVEAVTHPTQTLSSVGAALENATPQDVGRNVLAPIVTGGALGKVAGLAGGEASAAEAASPAAQYGLRTGADNPIARNVAGESARPAVTAHNQTIADQALGAQAGVAPGTPLTSKALETAREAPNSVYKRAENAIPTGPLSPTAAQTVASVGADDMVVRSPDTQSMIDAQKARLLSGDLTGPQVVNAQRALRFNGFKNVASADPEQSVLGHAQLKMSDALHQHMLDTIPAGADVSADQLNAARIALAQNHTVDNLLKGNNIDLQGLAKLHRDSPNILSGPLKDFAEFADLHPEVSSLPSKAERFNPSGLPKDLASIDLKSPATYLQPFFGAAARRVLTGGTEAPNVPVTGLGGEFAPIAQTPTAAEGAAGQISLGDLLSQGAEHNAPVAAPKTVNRKGRSKPLDESF